MTESEFTKTMILLSDLNITGLEINYSGGGDDGCIEYINYTKEPCKNVEDVREHLVNNGECLKELDSGIYSLLYDFINDVLLNNIEDWWNNDGGYGYVYMHVPSGKYEIDNNCYETIIHEYSHSGNILEKTTDGTSL